MSKELIERLRAKGNRYDDGAVMHGEPINPDGPAAADEIERLRAAIAALTTPADGLEEAFVDGLETGPDGNTVTWAGSNETAGAILTALRAAQPTERGAADYAALRALLVKHLIEFPHNERTAALSNLPQTLERTEHPTPTDTPATASRDAGWAFGGCLNCDGGSNATELCDKCEQEFLTRLATPPEPATASRDARWPADWGKDGLDGLFTPPEPAD